MFSIRVTRWWSERSGKRERDKESPHRSGCVSNRTVLCFRRLSTNYSYEQVWSKNRTDIWTHLHRLDGIDLIYSAIRQLGRKKGKVYTDGFCYFDFATWKTITKQKDALTTFLHMGACMETFQFVRLVFAVDPNPNKSKKKRIYSSLVIVSESINQFNPA